MSDCRELLDRARNLLTYYNTGPAVGDLLRAIDAHLKEPVVDPRCADCDIPNGCPEYCKCAPVVPNSAELSAEFERGRKAGITQVYDSMLKAQDERKALTNDTIREVFLRNGFTVKAGQTDLKPYVYAAARDLLATAAPKPAVPSGRHSIEHDGFEGDVIGHYTTREGKQGVVLQQVGTRVVHVYGTKWLTQRDQGVIDERAWPFREPL